MKFNKKSVSICFLAFLLTSCSKEVTPASSNSSANSTTTTSVTNSSNQTSSDSSKASSTVSSDEFENAKYESKTVTYDGLDHYRDIQITGFLPEGVSQTNLVVKNENNQIVTSAIDVGKYYYSVTLTSKTSSKTFNAVLTIKAARKDTPIISVGSNIYFSNGLDHYYLYRYSSSILKRADSSVSQKLKESNSSVLSISVPLMSDSVKEYTSSGTKSTLYTDSDITDFVKYSDNVYYYSKNAFSAENSGIFKVTNSTDDEPVVEKVFSGKTDKLQISGSYLYFENKANDNNIYRLNLSSKQTSLVLKQKVHEYIISSNTMYCTVNGLVNDYIGKLDLNSSATEATKITNDAGENLNILNNELYYNYSDLYGSIDENKKGVWKFNLNTNSNTQVFKSSVVNAYDVVSSSELVYVNSDNLHAYKYNISSKSSTDLMPDFTPVEETPLNLGGKSVNYKNKIYYLDMYRDKTLNCYDESTNTLSQLTNEKVMDFSIIGDTLYFNQVTTMTNNDLYSVNLLTGGDAVKLSSNDTRNIVSDGTYLYGTHYNFAGLSGGIFRMNLDGSDYIKFSEINGAKNFKIKDNRLYFINSGTGQDNGNIEYIELSAITSSSSKLKSTVLSEKIKNVKQFEFEGNNIYYIYNGVTTNSINRSDFTSLNEGVQIASKSTNPNEFIISGDYIYYYSYPASDLTGKNRGFYKVKKGATQDGTQEQIYSYKSTYYAGDFAIANNKLFFLNYIEKLTFGDAHFYYLNLSNNTITKVN